tara:strand:+ start:1021 stop:1587 length:567 start_codon:yes stop_codon:yes gene_type:complete
MKNFYSEIKEVQDSNCNDSLQKVIDRYSPVFISMYSKYIKPITDCGADPNDILSDKDLIIYESAMSFDLGEKSSFCTWLSNNVKYKCLHMISKQTKKQMLAERFKRNIETFISDYPYKNIEMNKFIFNTLNKIKDKRIKNVYSLRYFSGEKMTWSRIGKQLGFSSQTAINLHKRGAEILKRKITSKST